MELHAYTRTVSDLFSVKRSYVVPRFQREYSWAKEQIRELWDDITTNIIHHDGKFVHSEYFIGALVLVGDEASTSLKIVDGQQRLTTLTILLSVISDKFSEFNQVNLSDSIYNNYISGVDDDGEKYFKLVNETPNPFFQKNIQHNVKSDEKPTTDEERALFNCYREFHNLCSIRVLTKQVMGVESSNTDVGIDCLKALREQITKYLKVIYITVTEEEEAYTIFETLNARGMNLSFVDLIKNAIFKALKTTHPNDDAKDQWNKIRREISSRENSGSIENFVRHWWLSKYSYASAEKVYSSFRKKLVSGEIDAKTFISELTNDSKLYSVVSSPTLDDFKLSQDKYIFHCLHAFRIFGISQQRPFLLSLFRARQSKKISSKDMKDILFCLEKFHFVFNAVCSQRPSGLESAYSKAARELEVTTDKTASRKILNELKDKLKEKVPEYSVFRENFFELRFYDGYTKDKKLIQYILAKLERYSQNTTELTPEDLSIEHVLSQNNNDPQLVGMIGNLLPLGADINSSAGDKPVNEKLRYYKESCFQITQIFCSEYQSKYQSKWDEEQVNLRTKAICELAYNQVWKLD